MIRPGLSDYIDAYTLIKETITVPNTAAAGPSVNYEKKVIFENYAQFTDSVTEINNTQ